eukprot:scaffold18827_cov117-Isochrysis_galbana.AAC.8
MEAPASLCTTRGAHGPETSARAFSSASLTLLALSKSVCAGFVTPELEAPVLALLEGLESITGSGAAKGTLPIGCPGPGVGHGRCAQLWQQTNKPLLRCWSRRRSPLPAGIEMVVGEPEEENH